MIYFKKQLLTKQEKICVILFSIKVNNKLKARLKIYENLKTTSLCPKFTGSYLAMTLIALKEVHNAVNTNK